MALLCSGAWSLIIFLYLFLRDVRPRSSPWSETEAMGACGDGILLEKETLREGAQRWLREKKKGTALWPRLLLKALVDFCFPEAGWCTYVRGSAFWDFGGRWGRICGPPRVEIRQFAFLEEVTFIFGGSLTSFTPGLFLSCKQKALLILRSYTRFHGSMTGDWLWLCEIPQCSRSWQVDHAVDATCGLGWAVLTFLTSGSRSGC